MTALVTTQHAPMPLAELREMASIMSGSGMFGVKDATQAMALMFIAQAEGRHPATIAQEYDVIQGRPALKSQATLARFQAAGGRIQWTKRSDTECSAVFSHPQGGDFEICWTLERASKAGLTGKDNWKKFPSQMLAARVVAEGVRAVFPACLNGLYIAEEVQDMEPRTPEYSVQPPATATAAQATEVMKNAQKQQATEDQKRAAFADAIKAACVRIGVERVLEVVQSHGYDDPDQVQPKDFRPIVNAIKEIEAQPQQ